MAMDRSTHRITKRIAVRRTDGTAAELLEIFRTVPDPTSTGTIWKAPPMRYIDYELSTGEEVAKLEDGRFVICMTDEILTVLS